MSSWTTMVRLRVVALGARAPLRVERENPGAASVKEEPGAAHVKEEPGALLRVKTEDPGAAHVKEEPGALLRVKTEDPGAAHVKEDPGALLRVKREDPGAAHVKEDPGALLRVKREKSGVTLKYLEELHGVDILCVDTPSSASPASSFGSKLCLHVPSIKPAWAALMPLLSNI